MTSSSSIASTSTSSDKKPRRNVNHFLLEVCVDNFASAVAAETGGAGRIELCSSLLEGGLTPSVGFLKTVKSQLHIPVFVMIRPRGGDFIYSHAEIQVMEDDIKVLKANGADGFVFGILNVDGTVHTADCLKLLALTTPLPSTFHRAFDLTPDSEHALEEIISLGFDRILTSGQCEVAVKGIQLIRSLVRKAGGRVCIMAGAGITPTNISLILEEGEVTELHASCRKQIRSKNSNCNTRNVNMGSSPDEMNIYVTDENAVAAIVQEVSRRQGKLNNT